MYDHTFTTQQVLELVPMGYPSLNDLVRRGIIVPSKRRGVGRGTPSLYDVYDLVGIACVDFVRPRSISATTMSALYSYWHSPAGKRVVEQAAEARSSEGVVVVDGQGRVSYERELSHEALFGKRRASILTIVEPWSLLQGLFHDFALRRMTEPLPSGRLPRSRPRNPAQAREEPRRARKKNAVGRKTRR